MGAHTTPVTWERCGGPSGYRAYSRKREEYTADFCIVSRRMLDEIEYRIFRYHYLLGADWKLCCRQLKMDRGAFFHHVYRIEHQLGRVFAELTPYALYPVSEYFWAPRETSPMSPRLQNARRGAMHGSRCRRNAWVDEKFPHADRGGRREIPEVGRRGSPHTEGLHFAP